MLPWHKRPIEIANLLNPAFCSIVLRDVVKAYEDESNQGMPFILAFISLTIVLHKQTRDLLPLRTSTKQHMWLVKNSYLLVDFPKRAKDLSKYVKEAIMFGMGTGIFFINDEGNLVSTQKRLVKLRWTRSSEEYICRTKARFVGKWMAQSGNLTTILAMWRVSP